MIRSTIFWVHLVCGVAAGLVVLMMSVTGVILTYERQIVAWADRTTYPAPTPDAQRLQLEQLVDAAKQSRPELVPTTILLRNELDAPVVLGAGRNGSLLVDPYSGAVADPGAEGLRRFFAAVTGWHRWFNATGESRATARMITGASNLAFLFLILSGMYLWLPRIFKWAAFKTPLLFNGKATTAKARDFNWHHVFGIWSAIPLAIVVATATVFLPVGQRSRVSARRRRSAAGRGRAPASPGGPGGRRRGRHSDRPVGLRRAARPRGREWRLADADAEHPRQPGGADRAHRDR
jgi:uncharacterized iron-regulated membrane protein